MEKQINNPPPVRQKRRTKEQTKLLLIEAVGEIIKTEGYRALSERKIARQAGVSQHQIYKYFETPEKLIEKYLQKENHSEKYEKFMLDPEDAKQVDRLRYLLKSSLEKEYRRLLDNQNLHSLYASEISGKKLRNNIVPENDESDFTFLSAEHFFRNKAIDFPSLRFILESGVKFLALKSELKNSKYCGIDMASLEGREQVMRALKGIIDLAFEQKPEK